MPGRDPLREPWDVWRIDARRTVLVQPPIGPPAEICSFRDRRAAEEAARRGYATVSEIVFPRDCWRQADSAEEAMQVGQRWAQELGYGFEVYDPWWEGEAEDEELDWE